MGVIVKLVTIGRPQVMDAYQLPNTNKRYAMDSRYGRHKRVTCNARHRIVVEAI